MSERRVYVIEGRNRRRGDWVEQMAFCNYGARRKAFAALTQYRLNGNPKRYEFRVVFYRPTEER